MTFYNLTQLLTILLTGMLAGLFYGYDCSVIQGLGQLPDKEYLNAFQSINRAILTPSFFLTFLGSFVVLPIATWLAHKEGFSISFYFLLCATMVYGIGVLGVTFWGNVPLNDLLDASDLNKESESDILAMRQKFEMKWNLLHHIRTYASAAVFLFTVLSLLYRRQ